VVRYNQRVVKTVAIHIPDEVAELLAQGEADLQQELCLLLAVKLYELGRLSAGAAAQMAGLSRPEFLCSVHPFTTPIGRRRATLRAIPALWTTSTTLATSL
jgi:hypothetical protein